MGGGSLLSISLSPGVIQKHFLTTLTLSPSYPLLKATPSSSSSSTTTTTTTTTLSPYREERYLVDSCGLSVESAVQVSKKVKLLLASGFPDPEATIRCFKTYGFTDAHIARLILIAPWALKCKIEYTLRPKLDFLIEIGFAGELLPEIILKNPRFLAWSLESRLKVRHRLLRPYFDSDEKFVSAVFRNPHFMTEYHHQILIKNLHFLAKEGIPPSQVAKILRVSPKSVIQDHQRLSNSVRTAKEMGFDPKSLAFVRVAWNSKIELLKSFGWSEQEILVAFKRYPDFMSASEEKMRSAFDFYTNTAKLQLDEIIYYPMLFRFSVEKRALPRWKVLQLLKSHNLLKKDPKLPSCMQLSEKSFLQKYVTRFADKIPELINVYAGGTDKENGTID